MLVIFCVITIMGLEREVKAKDKKYWHRIEFKSDLCTTCSL